MSTTEQLNQALAGRYRVERHLGAGGMATVYLCEDLKHDRKVALKLLKPELAAVLGADRFVVEIKTTASLQHPHILPLFDSGTADGFLYYVMPFVEGETLRDKLNRETQLSVDEAVRIAREVLDALEYAHAHGIVHRDVKPENILLHGGHAMVADFGIALAVSAAAGGRMTETGLSLGTPHYMSPEQATAEKEITARSDVYSLGAVLYEMLSGSPPHVGASAQQIVMKIIAEPVQPVTTLRPSVPANVAGAVAKALERVPADRFESAKAFSEALANPAYTNATFAAATAGRAMTGRRSVPMRAFASVSALAVALLGLALWGWLKPAPAPMASHQRIVLWEKPQIIQYAVANLAISPDGGTMVFADSTAAGVQLFAKQRDQVDATPIAGTAGVGGNPTFSPDGQWIAFVGDDGKLRKVSRLGGSAVVLADSAFVSPPAWLDGGTILYVDGGLGLRAVAEDGGAYRQVLKGPSSGADTTSRLFVRVGALPGGHAALLTACTSSCRNSDLRVLDLRSLTVTVLQDHALQGWALPGGDVAFVRRNGDVFAAPFNMSRLRFSKVPTPMMDGVRTRSSAAEMAVSANGTVIYVAGAAAPVAGRYQPVWVTRTGAATPIDTSWTVPLKATNCTCDGAFAVSPDGRRLALVVWRDSTNGDITIKQLDQAPFALTPLTFRGDHISPVWTADGRSVVYSSTEKGNNDPEKALVRRRADGTGIVDTLLPIGSRNIIEVVPTRDTNTLIVRVNHTNNHPYIALVRRGDTTVTPLIADSGFAEINPALSPDGHWLAYASNETGHFEVYVRPFPDVNASRVAVSQAGGREPRWAHSGRELFFRNATGALVAAAVVPAATFALGTQAVLFEGRQFLTVGNETARSYDVAPGDQRFVFMRRIDPTGLASQPAPDKLVQITNWAAEVRAKLAGKPPK